MYLTTRVHCGSPTCLSKLPDRPLTCAARLHQPWHPATPLHQLKSGGLPPPSQSSHTKKCGLGPGTTHAPQLLKLRSCIPGVPPYRRLKPHAASLCHQTGGNTTQRQATIRVVPFRTVAAKSKPYLTNCVHCDSSACLPTPLACSPTFAAQRCQPRGPGTPLNEWCNTRFAPPANPTYKQRGLGRGNADAAVLLQFGLGGHLVTTALRLIPQQGLQSGDIRSGWGPVGPTSHRQPEPTVAA